ncbi:MAG TPA: GNAT family N-acetyltransferase [Anaeromyxobacter sp.]|nr:GNAT family N-acetyltransferase [Anaeromyxobacter sp.]
MTAGRRLRPPPAPPAIRPARPGDARAIAAVMRAAVRALAGRYPPATLASWASLPALYHRWAMGPGGERYLLAERGGRVAGYAALRDGELTALFVRPAAARRGVGRALVEAIARLAAREGATALRVRAARSAVPAYLRLGFAPGPAVPVPLPDGRRLPARLMVRPLSPPAPDRRGGSRRRRRAPRPRR